MPRSSASPKPAAAAKPAPRKSAKTLELPTPPRQLPHLHVGIGGWNYEPWHETFYPPGWPKARELEYASRRVTAIEVNSTYYGTQKPATFAKWRDQAPDGFVFSLKATRYATNRRVLAEAKESVDRFIESGIGELGKKLGPIVWQFAPTKVFHADDFEAFLELLPKKVDGHALRHAMDVRHESFMSAGYLALARKHGVATVFTDAPQFPSFADLTGGFAYARLMASQAELDTGYAPKALREWAGRMHDWAGGGAPSDLPRVGGDDAAARTRDVFVYFINGAKERAPAAAVHLIGELDQSAR